ncbi:hypothetical protein NDU88_003493 [Pleurodeles waltl]|uniref:Uncharacterized protein n=1 Tax=Pleurodeles waltl TaxID=8319 RepID=A0AAV7V1X3_PLEWA|nr:hypothetical protein NDU88_003493 [Pleurodeles waltl]
MAPRELTRMENNLGILEKATIADSSHARDLQADRIEYPERLEWLCIIVCRAYSQRTHTEADRSGRGLGTENLKAFNAKCREVCSGEIAGAVVHYWWALFIVGEALFG